MTQPPVLISLRHFCLTSLKAFAALLFAGVLTAAAADEPQNLQIYVLLGQSNMAGRGQLEKTREPLHPKILMLTREERWEPASEPLHFDKSIAGAGLG
ncbi:MAG: sialate O-acetylesterase, partial [Planctomyces sp.]